MRELATIPVTQLKGVASKLQQKLSNLHLYTVQDLLLHLPLRYEDRTRLVKIGSCFVAQSCVIEAEIINSRIIPARKRMLVCTIADDTGSLELRFFNFFSNQIKQLSQGAKIRCFGEVRQGRTSLEMVHPEYTILSGKSMPLEENLTPIYPSTEGLRQLRLRQLIEQALQLCSSHQLAELIPQHLLQSLGLPTTPLMEAIQFVHHPCSNVDLNLLASGKHPCQIRLAVEELLAHQLTLLRVKKQNKQFSASQFHRDDKTLTQFLSQFEFSPTAAQIRVTQEIYSDLSQSQPMMRLLQGDVGSGKTLVAMMSSIPVIAQGHQVALMAPTELLSEQHAISFSKALATLGYEVALLSGKVTGKARLATMNAIETGKAQMIIGTHALFQQNVNFHNLSLIIVDEQHRFGVGQRLSLKEKGAIENHQPHQLIMTATPIPRTLAMSAYADLDCSIIDELPPGRTSVRTAAISDQRRDEVINRIKQACVNEKRQVYWVCTLIEESEHLQCQAAENTHQQLTEQLPELSIGLIHGRMKSPDKIAIMERFKNGELHVLVATTVIEVGVDVPNASLMIIENSERLGLAQLHQLRGRVGRGVTVSHCVLLYHPPLSKIGQQRLAVLRETNDGFLIAEKDLELRGPGEVLGTKQTGLAEFKIADLYRDQHLIPKAAELAHKIINTQPTQSDLIIHRWIGHKQHFAKV